MPSKKSSTHWCLEVSCRCRCEIQCKILVCIWLHSLYPLGSDRMPVVIEKPYNRLQMCLLQLFIYLKVTSMFLYLDPVPSFLEMTIYEYFISFSVCSLYLYSNTIWCIEKLVLQYTIKPIDFTGMSNSQSTTHTSQH
jgi:hypothetical protein